MSDPHQARRVYFPGVPLANINILIPVDTHVMAMLKNGFVLRHHLELAVGVNRFFATGIGHHFIVFVQNSYEAQVQLHVIVVFRHTKTNPAVDILIVYHHTADKGAWQINVFNKFSVETKSFDGVLDAFGAKQCGVALITGVQRYTVNLLKLILLQEAIATKLSDKFAF